MQHRERDERPWGRYEVLDEGDGYKVKRIEVEPGQRLSYQKHSQRAEHWVVVSGSGLVTLDGKDIDISAASVIDIAADMSHRVENNGAARLVFIEIQRGGYLGEDDIVRLSDDYGRS